MEAFCASHHSHRSSSAQLRARARYSSRTLSQCRCHRDAARGSSAQRGCFPPSQQNRLRAKLCCASNARRSGESPQRVCLTSVALFGFRASGNWNSGDKGRPFSSCRNQYPVCCNDQQLSRCTADSKCENFVLFLLLFSAALAAAGDRSSDRLRFKKLFGRVSLRRH
jgi:hypothetical protein